MQRILLLYQTEGGAAIRRDLTSLGAEVETQPLAEAESALALPGLDAVVIEAATNLEETHRLIESPSRPRSPILLLMRAEQLAGLDPTWPLDDFLILPVMAEEL